MDNSDSDAIYLFESWYGCFLCIFFFRFVVSISNFYLVRICFKRRRPACLGRQEFIVV